MSIAREVLQDKEVIQFIQENKEYLTEESIERSAANLYEFVVEKNKARKGEGQLLDGYYPKLVLNHKKIEVSYAPKITVGKGVKKGTKVRITVKVAATKNYKAYSKSIIYKVK